MLQSLNIRPIPFVAAKQLLLKHHYLHSLPGGTKLGLGVFLNESLLGVITFGAGPALTYSLVKDAAPEDCLVLSRLWLSDLLPKNSESHVIAIALRHLKKYTRIRFVVSYADPSAGHVGTIYQASNWLYIGQSEAMPLFDIGDGKARHSRSLSHAFGSHSVKYLKSQGINVKLVDQAAKHRYIYFLDPKWRTKLNTKVLPYPKKGILK